MADSIKYFAHIKAKSSCPDCSSPIFINGPVEKVICSSCMTEVKIGKDTIIDYFTSGYDDLKTSPMREARITYLGHPSSYIYGNNPPKCPKCEEKIPTEKLVENEKEQQWNIECEKCGNSISVSKTPKWIRKKVPTAKIVINTEFEQVKANEKPKSEVEIKGIVFSCPKCSAGLEVDGTKRVIDCKYCSSSVYLPDDLWLRLHPVEKVKEWYIGFTNIKAIIIIDKRKKLKEKNKINYKNIKILRAEILQMIAELEDSGVFKGKQKKELQEDIENKEKEIIELDEKIKKTISRMNNIN
jgi:DNA-directed RNA polymerase subunit RPC12/RpoP